MSPSPMFVVLLEFLRHWLSWTLPQRPWGSCHVTEPLLRIFWVFTSWNTKDQLHQEWGIQENIKIWLVLQSSKFNILFLILAYVGYCHRAHALAVFKNFQFPEATVTHSVSSNGFSQQCPCRTLSWIIMKDVEKNLKNWYHQRVECQ